jgi:hypothetical protein
MKVDILIRSYRGDIGWLKYSLKSIDKFCSGFNKIHIVVPEEDFQLIDSITGVEKHKVKDNCSGYLAQQYTKLCADQFSDAEHVLHVDSDVVFTRPTTPHHFFSGGKPIVLQEKDVQTPWRAISAQSLGWEDEYEYMRRMPIIYPRWIYPEFRAWMEQKHGVSLEAHICSHPPMAWSEFNTLGQWAKRYHIESFEWMNPQFWETPCIQFWSWGGLDAPLQRPDGHTPWDVSELEKLLA